MSLMVFIFWSLSLAQHELRCGIGCAWIVAAVYLCMTIQTGTSLGDVGGAFTEPVRRGGLGAGNLTANHLRNEAAVRRMALMAQERRAHFQHAFGDGAMRVMTVAAVLADRLVVVHKWPALFGVALITGIDHAIAFHQLGSD